MSSNNHNASDLFPVPSSPSSPLIPKHWPGISTESTAALQEILQDNHVKWNIFFNDSGFHNHIAHRAIAYWALGAAGDLIKAGYKADSSYQRPAFESPEKITEKNFKDHLGDRQFYEAYLTFFTDVVRQKGAAAAVEQYIFAKDVNIDPSAKKKPDMFNRFLGGLVHPMIHLGYGLEFNIPGMVIEGNSVKGNTEDTFSRFKSLLISSSDSKPASDHGTHVFTVVARILKDAELGKVPDTESGMFIYTMTNHVSKIIEHMADWRVDGTNLADVENKVQELSWLNSILYGIGGWSKDKPFNADFFHMHLVTSSIFLAPYVACLKPSSIEHLLRGYLLVSLAWWISRGRPSPNIAEFYASTTSYPSPSGAVPSPHKDALQLTDPTKVITPNAWLPIIQTSIVHPDDHLPKLQRALAHYASLYGTREAGRKDFTETELEGAEKLDGSLFIRVAGLTAERLGRVREGKEAGHWDRDGFYEAKL
ncbi:hypothetical protein C0993_001915 [Termitomyces sp. T159_Od127]|nr:hypothetical protein C0993_001915 [Termitomyces sp. T159_Od127]